MNYENVDIESLEKKVKDFLDKCSQIKYEFSKKKEISGIQESEALNSAVSR